MSAKVLNFPLRRPAVHESGSIARFPMAVAIVELERLAPGLLALMANAFLLVNPEHHAAFWAALENQLTQTALSPEQCVLSALCSAKTLENSTEASA
jgi:hypothetical protein